MLLIANAMLLAAYVTAAQPSTTCHRLTLALLTSGSALLVASITTGG